MDGEFSSINIELQKLKDIENNKKKDIENALKKFKSELNSVTQEKSKLNINFSNSQNTLNQLHEPKLKDIKLSEDKQKKYNKEVKSLNQNVIDIINKNETNKLDAYNLKLNQYKKSKNELINNIQKQEKQLLQFEKKLKSIQQKIKEQKDVLYGLIQDDKDIESHKLKIETEKNELDSKFESKQKEIKNKIIQLEGQKIKDKKSKKDDKKYQDNDESLEHHPIHYQNTRGINKVSDFENVSHTLKTKLTNYKTNKRFRWTNSKTDLSLYTYKNKKKVFENQKTFFVPRVKYNTKKIYNENTEIKPKDFPDTWDKVKNICCHNLIPSLIIDLLLNKPICNKKQHLLLNHYFYKTLCKKEKETLICLDIEKTNRQSFINQVKKQKFNFGDIIIINDYVHYMICSGTSAKDTDIHLVYSIWSRNNGYLEDQPLLSYFGKTIDFISKKNKYKLEVIRNGLQKVYDEALRIKATPV